MSNLKKASILNMLQVIIIPLTGLLLTPYIIKVVGVGDYGVYALIGGFLAFMKFMDMGLYQAVVRYVSKYLAEKEENKIPVFLGTVLKSYALISILLILIFTILYFNLSYFFENSLTAAELILAKKLYFISAGLLLININAGILIGVLLAYEKMFAYKLMHTLHYILRPLLIIALLYAWPEVIMVSWAHLIAFIVFFLAMLGYISKKMPQKISFKQSGLGLFKEVFSYSIWVFLYAIAQNLQWLAGQIIVGMTIDSEAVAIFSLAFIIVGMYAVLGGSVNQFLLPRATQIHVQKLSEKEINEEMIKKGRINLLILLPFLFLFFIWGEEFVILWLGESFRMVWVLAMIMIAVMTFPLVYHFGDLILEAMKKNKYKAVLHIVTLSVASIFAAFLSKKIGIMGALYPLAMVVIVNTGFMFLYFKKMFDFKIITYIYQVFLKVLLPNIILAFLMLMLKKHFILAVNTWWLLVLFVMITSFVLFLLNYIFVLNNTEKDLLKWRVLKKKMG